MKKLESKSEYNKIIRVTEETHANIGKITPKTRKYGDTVEILLKHYNESIQWNSGLDDDGIVKLKK